LDCEKTMPVLAFIIYGESVTDWIICMLDEE
jgi:hypothetical protein